MSDSPTLRFASTLTLALVLVACGAETGSESTLPATEVPANPASDTGFPAARADAGVERAPTLAREEVADFVSERARVLAADAWHAPTQPLPTALAGLDYDAYRSIRYRPEAALWRDEGPYRIHLFHPGYLFDEPVRIHLVEDSSRVVPFDPGTFRYEGAAADLPGTLEGTTQEHAGFRVHSTLNAADRWDEFLVFQGASYFRLVGRGQLYGLSARGLAVDPAAEQPEEFPHFRAFWLVRPRTDADSLLVHALLDSPSITGAYRFAVATGECTVVDVDARLFARSDVGKLGVAPLSSMYLFGPASAAAFDDVRAGVHDSDGLLAHTREGEWIWRPLSNRRGLRVSSLRDVDPRGFGLAQRARDFDDYLDSEALYHRRPSVWIRIHPDDRWGAGGVELLEIPTETEFSDNIAAYWVPDGPMRAGETRRFRYTVSTFADRLDAQTLAQVVRSRSGRVSLPGASAEADAHTDRVDRRFVVDFAGGRLDALPSSTTVEARVETLAGDIDEVRAEPLPGGAGWRASFRVSPDGDRPADMRLLLVADGEPLTETWSYVWYPGMQR